ncbi:hypothetical protein ON010_g7358 [Phytophthora cinnamomi]|nr:hypothetical protein ON010_g7358 [Phytophthora cinnamomi]
MSSIRVWVLLLLMVNGLWGLLVAAQEERAYRIARRTYLTSVEILALVTVVSFMMRNHIFSMCEIKWTLERQRLYDFTSFPGFLAHSNSFNLGLDSVVITPADVLWVQYGPLVRIIGTSFGVLLLYSVLKTAYLMHYNRVAAWISSIWRERRGPGVVTASGILKSTPSMQDLLDSTGSTRQQSQQHRSRYERSELEVLLNCPVRAKSIIRNSMELEKTNSHGLPEVSPSCALDFGVMVRDGEAHSRVCFWGVFTKQHKRISLQAESESPTVRSRRRSSTVFSTPRSSFSLLSSSVTPLNLSQEGPRISGTGVLDAEKPRKRRSIEQ